MRRSVICIGVDRPQGMRPLQDAARGAEDFAAFARRQGCLTTEITDRAGPVTLSAVFDAVRAVVNSRTSQQLIVYFAGHGILTAPGVEYWLLSGAPQNPNEAVNLYKSVEDARNSGIPHIVFVSDACRSSVSGPPLSGVAGGGIFPSLPFGPARAEVDVFYATRPGDPAYEVSESTAVAVYGGIFTAELLRHASDAALSEPHPTPPPANVITSRRLKPILQTTVPATAGAINAKHRQVPEIRVESALPLFFSDPGTLPPSVGPSPGPTPPTPTVDAGLERLEVARVLGGQRLREASDDLFGLRREAIALSQLRGRPGFESETGFTIHGAGVVEAFHASARVEYEYGQAGEHHVRLWPAPGTDDEIGGPPPPGTSTVLRMDEVAGVLPMLPGFVGTVVVRGGRIVSVAYVPARHTPRYMAYEPRADQLDEMRALAAVAARHGRFHVPDASAGALADRIRVLKGLDPVLGIYAAYAYAQIGRHDDVRSVFSYMLDDSAPIPFDVALLVGRDVWKDAPVQRRIAPFAPMLSQGWALLDRDSSLPDALRSWLVPSLWTTYRAGVVGRIMRLLEQEEIR